MLTLTEIQLRGCVGAACPPGGYIHPSWPEASLCGVAALSFNGCADEGDVAVVNRDLSHERASFATLNPVHQGTGQVIVGIIVWGGIREVRDSVSGGVVSPPAPCTVLPYVCVCHDPGASEVGRERGMPQQDKRTAYQ